MLVKCPPPRLIDVLPGADCRLDFGNRQSDAVSRLAINALPNTSFVQGMTNTPHRGQNFNRNGLAQGRCISDSATQRNAGGRRLTRVNSSAESRSVPVVVSSL
jgi:hypothetical protein